ARIMTLDPEARLAGVLATHRGTRRDLAKLMGGVIGQPSCGLGLVRPPSDRPDGTFARGAVNVTHSQLAFAVEAEIGSNPLGDRATMTEAVPAAPETALFVTDD